MPLADVLNPPAADSGVPQANTESIARSLVGNDLVDKFGHAMGVRPPTTADVLRDTYLGATIGPANVRKLHADAQKQLQDQNIQALRVGLAQQAADRQKANFILSALSQVRDPKYVAVGYRKDAFTRLMQSQGIKVDPVIAGMLTKEDGISEQQVKDLVDTSRPKTAGELSLNLSDIKAGLDWIGTSATIAHTRQATANAVVENERQRLAIDTFRAKPVPETPREKEARMHHAWLLRQTQPVVDPNTGDIQVDDLGKPLRQRLPMDIIDREMATRFPEFHATNAPLGEPGPAGPEPILGMPPIDRSRGGASSPTTAGSPRNASAGAFLEPPILGMPEAVTAAPAPPRDLSKPNIRGIVQQ